MGSKMVDWLQSLKQFFINVSYHILVASLTLMALFTYHNMICHIDEKKCFKDWSQSSKMAVDQNCLLV